jgi:predicted Zn-dependent peptidase
MAGWAAGEPLPPVPVPGVGAKPGVYVVNKDDVNQTRVLLGHRSTTWDDPDAIALELMNDILGGSGFTSRITRRVRSDEGLAYSAGSFYGLGRDFASSFAGLFQSKNRSVARAIALTVEEIERIRAEPVSAEELDVAVSSAIDSFPQRFSSANAKAGTFVEDEIWGRPPSWWKDYRPKVRAVTAEKLQLVAREHLAPDQLTVLVVGKISEVLAGDPDHPEHRLEDFASEGGILEVALPDPLSLEYPHPPRPLARPKVEGGMDG